MEKIFTFFLLFVSLSNWLYFTLKNGESKCFNYDMSRRSTFVGEYTLLDYVPNLEATGDGVRANLYEPNSSSYFTKVFQGQDSQVFTVRVPGIHKVWFEGTRYLFQSVNSVRVSVKMRDDIKHEKLVDKALKTDDIKESQETINQIRLTLSKLQNTLERGDYKLNDFEELKNQYISRMKWSYIFTIFIVIGCSAFEAYLLRTTMLKGSTKLK